MNAALRLLCPCLIFLLAHTFTWAQEAAPTLRGQTLDGREFDLARQRGRVVLVLLWRTDCAVCLDKMPELRANALGWKGKPFDLVLINLDARSTDVQTYDRLRRQTNGADVAVHSLWRGNAELPAAWRDASRLPTTLVIDRQGRLSARYEGRVPPEAWDQVADLLP